jgi:serine/threonine protein kinase
MKFLASLGAGGMGEVYRARDTRLKREVALKVLPEAFTNDPERMARFQREAEVLASINHPNIAHVYGLEEQAIAMELVEGKTLAGPLSIDTALDYARQIAEALECAHEKGVIHRDLKPANIKVTPEGVVKVLDFGLAKAIEDRAAAVGDPAISHTLTVGATRVGTILGTAAYMSPEQAAGKAADRRSDIWSFGAVLYEMLTGKRAFDGESVSENSGERAEGRSRLDRASRRNVAGHPPARAAVSHAGPPPATASHRRGTHRAGRSRGPGTPGSTLGARPRPAGTGVHRGACHCPGRHRCDAMACDAFEGVSTAPPEPGPRSGRYTRH